MLARHRHSDGGWRWLLWSGTAHAGRWYASAKDVTDWIRLEQRIGRDALTTLPTREVFNEELGHALERHARSRQHLGVLVVDIDAFKQVNDSIGHEAGDRLLIEAAARLREAVRAGDIVARLGGDEFAILLELLDSDHEAVTIARRVVAAFDEPFELGGDPVDGLGERRPGDRARREPRAPTSSSTKPTSPCTARRPRRAAASRSSTPACAPRSSAA